jgi:glycosyltransferase involved in cell wall biosynthesis
MRLLTFTTLYPNAVRPHHGIFVEQRLRQLRAAGGVALEVVAPVPWFPFSSGAFGRYAEFARVPYAEDRHGIQVRHPRYLLLPKVGMTLAPYTLAAAGLRSIGRLIREGYGFDAIDAHYFYPDGVAAAMIARRLRKPLVITARGTDINLVPRYRMPRRQIRWAAQGASAIITVCDALKTALAGLGVPEEKITVLRNGVDLRLFRPADREAERRRLGLNGTTLLSVGHLTARKGHDIVIRALVELPAVQLLIAGIGEEEAALRRLADSLGIAARVRFLGAVPQEQLRSYYGAADALVLASSREGWANVLLESMACGTPVIATDVWGTPEVVAAPEAGVLMRERSPRALVEAYERLFAAYPDRVATRRYAERFSWDATTAGQQALFARVLERAGPG